MGQVAGIGQRAALRQSSCFVQRSYMDQSTTLRYGSDVVQSSGMGRVQASVRFNGQVSVQAFETTAGQRSGVAAQSSFIGLISGEGKSSSNGPSLGVGQSSGLRYSADMRQSSRMCTISGAGYVSGMGQHSGMGQSSDMGQSAGAGQWSQYDII